MTMIRSPEPKRGHPGVHQGGAGQQCPALFAPAKTHKNAAEVTPGGAVGTQVTALLGFRVFLDPVDIALHFIGFDGVFNAAVSIAHDEPFAVEIKRVAFDDMLFVIADLQETELRHLRSPFLKAG